MSENNKALEVKKSKPADDDIVTLSTGVRVKLHVVTGSTMQSVLDRLEPPKVPVFHNKDLGRDDENPNDPDYKIALENYMDERNRAVVDALLIWGVELVDPVPTDGFWMKGLKRSAKLGHVNLDEFDLEDEDDLEFLYKRHYAVGNEDFVLIRERSGNRVTQVEVDKSRSSFRGDEERSPD